ncbi:MAG TPA: SelB C-terminal domain-containing protein [Acidimicrobiales bacterium]|nr:SelB C-terminal domain-containing protein [Acidimicrobiales bacterium]
MRAQVVGTAGHVDHGKSTLVWALTGMDPDRLAEEQERGLTIDLGFAWTTLASGREVAFVDVPGHVRFLKNMLAGAGAVGSCLFVVSAAEGWKPQSEEHLRILELFGQTAGLIALTNVAALDAEQVELARLEIGERVAGSWLESAEIVEVDAPASIGVDAVAAGLDRMLAAVDALGGAGPGRAGRLWVDRSFAVAGSGTVVTGTLAGGTFAVGDRLLLVPGPGPDGRPLEVRVRALQRHGRAEPVAGPGRVAVNLAGVHHHLVRRGIALVPPGCFEPTRTVDVSLRVLAALDHPVSRRGAYRAYFGSGQHAVGLRLLGRAALAPGEQGCARLHLPAPLALRPGDRYVLREAGRSETVGGGEVLDVAPVLPAARARPDRDVDRVVRERGVVDPDLLERLTGERRDPNLGGRFVVDPELRRASEGRLREALASAGPLGLDVARLRDVDRAYLGGMADVEVEGGLARLRREPAGTAGSTGCDSLERHPYLLALRATPFRPPSPEELGVERRELRELVRRGLVVESEGCWFAASAVAEAVAAVESLLAEEPGGVTASAVKERLGTSRKYVLPLLAHLDTSGVTRRRGDLRVAGPRLAAAVAAGRAGEPAR